MSVYTDLLLAGPFPGCIDIWAENDHYFQQIHSGMIEAILAQISQPLLNMGYIANKEHSLQVLAGRQPDISVEQNSPTLPVNTDWNYIAAAEKVRAEVGVEAQDDSPLYRIDVASVKTGELVTVLEIISPGNKLSDEFMLQYQVRRSEMVRLQGVNVVEIDPTRSIKRLLNAEVVRLYPYHAVVYLPDSNPRVIGSPLMTPLKRFALPLRQDVYPVEPQQAYDYAYQNTPVAAQLRKDGRYKVPYIPFASLLTSVQRDEALQAVAVWEAELARLAPDDRG